MALLLDARDHRPEDRFEVVREAVWATMLRVDLEFAAGRDIHADLRFHLLGPLAVCSAEANCVEIRRTARRVSEDSEAAVFLGLQRTGSSLVIQGDRQTAVRPGQLVVYDSAEPYVLANRTGVSHHYFRVPKRDLALPAPILARLIALQLDPDNPVTRLLQTYLYGLVAELTGDQPLSGPEVARPTVELIRAAVAAQFPDDRLAREPVHETLHHRIMAYLELHLAEHDLTPARIAAAHHISVRQLYAVLSRAGVSLGDWIRTRRLEQCRTELAAGTPHLTVAGVGRRWGFVNATHFSRLFREAYGVAPREYLRARVTD